MQRDIALKILGKLQNLKTVVSNAKKEAQVLTRSIPVILEQPQSYVGPAGGNATFTVVAENVAAYQWQTKKKIVDTWGNSGITGNKTDTIHPSISVAYTEYEYRCKITGIDDSVIYSDVVDITIVEG